MPILRLVKMTIDSFKTIATPQDLLFDTKTTILVGANESGKTNVLQAIEYISEKKALKKEDVSKINRSKRKLPCFTFTFALDRETEDWGRNIPELSGIETITIKRNDTENRDFTLSMGTNKKFFINTLVCLRIY